MTLEVLFYILVLSAVLTVIAVITLVVGVALVVYGIGGIMYLIRRFTK